MKGVINILGVDYKYYTVYIDPDVSSNFEDIKTLYVKYKRIGKLFYRKIPLISYNSLWAGIGTCPTESEFYKQLDMTDEELLSLIEQEITKDIAIKNIEKRKDIDRQNRINKFNKKYNSM